MLRCAALPQLVEREARDDARLARQVAALATPTIHIACCRIEPHHAYALWPAEAVAVRNAVAAVRQRSGAARHLARLLLAQCGRAPVAIPRAGSGASLGAPVWPAGFVGAMAHDATHAVVALARAADVHGIGIDIEPAEPLPADLAVRVMTDTEQRLGAGDALFGRRMFVAKEAVFKALFPRHGRFLDFHDIEIDAGAGMARTRCGAEVSVTLSGSRRHIVGLARL